MTFGKISTKFERSITVPQIELKVIVETGVCRLVLHYSDNVKDQQYIVRSLWKFFYEFHLNEGIWIGEQNTYSRSHLEVGECEKDSRRSVLVVCVCIFLCSR